MLTPVIVVGPGLPPFEIDGVETHCGDHRSIARDRIVAVVDTDPSVIWDATVRGVDAVMWDTPDNRHFSWHFRATTEDVVHGLQRRLKEWRDRAAFNDPHCTCPQWGNPSWPHRHGCPAVKEEA